MENTKCKICISEADYFFKKKVLFRHDVYYFRCKVCGFLFTENPYWLLEAYQEDIKGIRDIGMVQRNLQVAELTAQMIRRHFDPKSKFVDYGAGTGLLVRLMRDKGYDYYYDDPFARNIFARCFEAKLDIKAPSQYELLTAFEVFEHSPDPLADMRRMLLFSDSVLFSTELQPINLEALENWFYILPDAGQHVAFYTREALSALAFQLGMRFISDGVSLHFMTKRSITLHSSDLVPGHLSLMTRAIRWIIRKSLSMAGGPMPMQNLVGRDAAFVNKLLKEKAEQNLSQAAKNKL